MKGKQITLLYPVLTEELIQDMGMAINTSFNYNNEKNDVINLVKEDNSTEEEFSLNDRLGDWDFKQYNLNIVFNIKIDKPNIIFDKNKGIARKDSIVELVLVLESPISRKTTIIPLFDIKNIDEKIDKDIKVHFDRMCYFGNLNYYFLFCLKKSGNNEDVSKRDFILANEPGMIISPRIDCKTINFEGNGSLINIDYVDNLENGKVWELEFAEFSDPNETLFNESFKIHINNKSNISKFLVRNEENKDFNMSIFLEIIEEVLTIVIHKYIVEEDLLANYNDGDDFYEGSVTQALLHFRSTLEITKEDNSFWSILKKINGLFKNNQEFIGGIKC